MSPVQDGQPLHQGVVTREEQEQALFGGKPDDRPLPLSPAQARQREADAWPDTVGAPGYARRRAVVRSDAEVAKGERVEFTEKTTTERGAKVAEQLHNELQRVRDDVNDLVQREEAAEATQVLVEGVAEGRRRLEALKRRVGM